MQNLTHIESLCNNLYWPDRINVGNWFDTGFS